MGGLATRETVGSAWARAPRPFAADATEPSSHLYLGQITLWLLAADHLDLRQPETRRFKGIATVSRAGDQAHPRVFIP